MILIPLDLQATLCGVATGAEECIAVVIPPVSQSGAVEGRGAIRAREIGRLGWACCDKPVLHLPHLGRASRNARREEDRVAAISKAVPVSITGVTWYDRTVGKHAPELF